MFLIRKAIKAVTQKMAAASRAIIDSVWMGYTKAHKIVDRHLVQQTLQR